MDYMFLLYSDEQGAAHATPEQRAASMTRQWAIIDDATARGVLKGVSPLEPSSASITVRGNRNGPVFSDGPFAETKEALGGFYLIDCKNLDDAKYWAGRMSETGCGSVVEIRALRAIPTRPDRKPEPAAMANA
jgi:hypothetical protein